MNHLFLNITALDFIGSTMYITCIVTQGCCCHGDNG